MVHTPIISIDESIEQSLLFGKKGKKRYNKPGRDEVEKKKIINGLYCLYQNQNKQNYLKIWRSDVAKAVQGIEKYIRTKADERKINENPAQAEAYLNNAMTQLAVLKDRLLNETFKIDDLQNFVDQTESANDWLLIKSVVELIYLLGKKDLEPVVYSKDRIIAARDSELDSFREREESRKIRQQNRVSLTSKLVQERANANALKMQPIFKELNDSGFTTLRSMADELNKRNIPCLNGGAQWQPNSIRMIKIRIKDLELAKRQNLELY